jgi:hypothetical protein
MRSAEGTIVLPAYWPVLLLYTYTLDELKEMTSIRLLNWKAGLTLVPTPTELLGGLYPDTLG